jgi:hypothetical protein
VAFACLTFVAGLSPRCARQVAIASVKWANALADILSTQVRRHLGQREPPFHIDRETQLRQSCDRGPVRGAAGSRGGSTDPACRGAVHDRRMFAKISHAS